MLASGMETYVRALLPTHWSMAMLLAFFSVVVCSLIERKRDGFFLFVAFLQCCFRWWCFFFSLSLSFTRLWATGVYVATCLLLLFYSHTLCMLLSILFCCSAPHINIRSFSLDSSHSHVVNLLQLLLTDSDSEQSLANILYVCVFVCVYTPPRYMRCIQRTNQNHNIMRF